MKYLILFSFILSTQLVYSQTNYSKGFSDGYNKGYCYGKLNGCLARVVPSTPVPKIGESYDSYVDGYNRGVFSGRDAADQQSVVQSQDSPYKYPFVESKVTPTPLFKPDFQFYQQLLVDVSQRPSTNQRNIPELSEDDRAVLNELNNPVKVKQQTQYINFLRNYYVQQSVLPSHLLDGNYQATRICDPHSVETVDVVVKNNRVIAISEINPFSKKYNYTLDVNEYPDYKNQTIIDVIRQPVNITNGMAKYSPETTGKPTGAESTRTFYQNDFVYELYFLDEIVSYQQVQKRLFEVRKDYKAKTKYSSVQDGWQLCYATDGEAFCDVRKVYVQSGKITQYKTGQGVDCTISSGGTIINDRSNISYNAKDSGGNDKMLVMEIYFL